MSNAESTTVVGYYNGNKWPIQLVISHFNITLHLQPGEYILDKQGRKINDPFFDAYAASKQLAREISGTPVPVIRVPLPVSSAATSIPDGQSVRAVTQFTHDVRGLKVPVIPQPRSFPTQAVNKSSVTPMSMEEARRAGLVRKTREVPEDFGQTDGEGAPPRQAPTIRYATDVGGPAKPPPPLPAQLVEDMPQGRQALVAQLSQATTAPAEPENAAIFGNTVTPTAPPDSTIKAGVPGPTPPQPVVLPPPQLGETVEAGVPEPPVEEEAPQPAPARTGTGKDKYVCLACGKGFPFRSQLERHANQVHKSDFEAVMSPYPETR